MTPTRSSVCNHGISDDVDITDKTVVTNEERGTRAMVIGYYCHQHGRHGFHKVVTDLEVAKA